MRNIIRPWILVLAAALLAACGPTDLPAFMDEPGLAGQTIVLWHDAGSEERRALLDLVDQFNATNPWRLLVVPEYRGDPPELASALKAAIASGRTPDLLLGRPIDATWLGDSVAPVEPYVSDPRFGLSRADTADMYAAFLDANRDPHRDGALVGFPVGGDGTVLVYNADRLAAAGYLTPPNSWPLFREVCLVTTIDRNGDRRPDVHGFGFSPRAEFVAAWFMSRGAPLLLPDGHTLGFDNPAGIKVLETISEAAQGGCFLSTPGADADLDAFSVGRVAMIFTDVSRLREIDRAVKNRGGFRWGMTPVPYGQQPITLDVSGRSWLVMRSAPEKQLGAWLFARWFSEPEQAYAWALNTGQLPLRASAADRLKREHDQHPVTIAALDLLPFGHATPLVPYWPEVTEAATRAVLAVVAGDAPELAHGQARDAINQLVAP